MHIGLQTFILTKGLYCDVLTYAAPMIRMLLLLIVVVAVSSSVYARHPVFKATRLTSLDGLSDDMVLCALQDSRGFMWFGTRNGLNRYDGYRITVFHHQKTDTTSLSDVAAHSLLQDSRGRLWIGSTNSVNLFDPVSERFTRYCYDPRNPDGMLPGEVVAICEDRTGCLWLITDNTQQGLQKLNPETGVITTYRHNPHDPYSLSNNSAGSICRDSSGTIWVVTGNGLNRYDYERDRFINQNTAPSYRFASEHNLLRVFADRDGGLWLANRTTNMWKVNIRNDKVVSAERLQIDRSSISDNSVISITRGIGTVLWVGTEGGGVYTGDVQTREFHKITSTAELYGLASNQIFMLYGDSYGDMWICTDQGVQRFHSRTNSIQHFSYDPVNPAALAHQNVRSLLVTKGRLLIGTGGGGLNIGKGDDFHHYVNPYNSSQSAPVDILSNTINTLYALRDGTVLAGTNNGLYSVQISSGRFVRVPYTIFGPRVWSICESRDGVLWVGTLFNGLTRIDRATGRLRYYFADQKVQRSGTPVSVHVLYEDARGTLWIGTNNGLYRMERSSDTPVRAAWNTDAPGALSHDHIWSICETHDGRLWLATTGGGLNLFDPVSGRCTRFGKAEGLPSDVVCGVLADSKGNLWASTNTGLCRLTPSTGKVVTFGIDDGLYVRDFHLKTCFRDTSGAMYFGGSGGYVCFHPDSMAIRVRPRTMVFTSFKVFDRRVVPDTSLLFKKRMVLPHSSNYFSAEFAALDFAGAHNHKYRYRLESYDGQWRHTDGTRPFADYTDVPPGDYRLVVEVADVEGNWGAASASLGISIMPAWWQTLWFRSALALFCVAAGTAVLRWYLGSVRRKSAMERRLVELQLHALRAQMNPHFIFNSLNSIYYYILSREDEKAQTYLGLFSVLLRQILEYSRKPFISIRREIEILELYLQLESMRFSQRFGYKVSVAPSIDVEKQLIPTMLLQPYVENAIKHGLLPKEKDCMLTIEFSRSNDRILCSITDNGIGRKMSGQLRDQSLLPHTSQGLALSKERMENLSELHGKLYGVELHDLTTDTGEALGTRIVLTFPTDVDEELLGLSVQIPV